MVRPQSARNVGVVECDFPAPVSSYDVSEDRNKVRVIFVIVLGGEFGGREVSLFYVMDGGICERSMRKSELHIDWGLKRESFSFCHLRLPRFELEVRGRK